MAELQRRMSSQEFVEWMAYYRMEPFGEERADMRAGIVASTVANSVRDPKKRNRPYKPDEFMVDFDKQLPDEETNLQKMLGQIEALNKLYGGRDMRNKNGNTRDASR